MPANHLLLSCEHGGNRVPAEFSRLFRGQDAMLATHRGYDIGALEAARYLRDQLQLPLISATVTRLLVDLNRSPGHPRRFSEFTRDLDAPIRDSILQRYYDPYRRQVETQVAEGVAGRGRVFHLSVHSFVPALDGRERSCDIGLLYDPSRPLELAFCRDWQQRLQVLAPELVVRRNYPYRGVADGLVTFLRKRFGPRQYAGIELEINQRLAQAGGKPWRRLMKVLAASLQHL